MEKAAGQEENVNDKWLKAAINIYFKKPNLESIDPKSVEMIIPSGEESPSSWRYTEKEPKANWFLPDFDDSAWQEGTSVFGTPELKPKVKTAWTHWKNLVAKRSPVGYGAT